MGDMQQNGHNSNRLSPLLGKDDGGFAEGMNYFYARFDKYDFRSVIDDITSFTCGRLHMEEQNMLTVFQCRNVQECLGPSIPV